MWVLKGEETHPFLFNFRSGLRQQKNLIFAEVNVANMHQRIMAELKI